ncbi:MAG: hypothetical protein JO112_09155, partial [Planctomycetes bacterium]|nr:hypothetical protein [Planctomycetota bacterium]
MNRRSFVLGLGGVAVSPGRLLSGSAPPAPAPNPEPHFPDRLHLFVWRNWELADTARMAVVVRCRAEDILDLGSSLGLTPKPPLSADQLRRLYITVIRQNWRLLPNEQIIQLLGWTKERFQFTLREDDFLESKLGPKPACLPLVYAPPGPEARKRAAEIRQTILTHLRGERDPAGEPAFAFIRRLSDRTVPSWRDPEAKPSAGQIDLSGWTVHGEKLDGRIPSLLADFLARGLSTGPVPARSGRIRLRIDPALGEKGERFTVAVAETEVDVVGNHAGSLLQALSWLQAQMEEHGGPFLTRGRVERSAAFHPRYLYSYFALYGDPLLEPDLDPFPDGYLEKLARVGVNGVWLQGVLRTLAPARTFPEFGQGSAERLANLNRLVHRAKQFGVKVYLYLNEPRAMPGEFFRDRPDIRGAEQGGLYALCTAVPAVRQWMTDSLAHVFERVPELGGVFSITMSENLTNCFSHFRPDTCPRCSRRANWGEGVGEVLEAIREGVRRSSPQAEVIVWDWGWTEPMARYLIPRLPEDVRFLSVSEWGLPVQRGGVKATVGEYALSVVGPGPQARARWSLARKAGVSVLAKTQFNNTWELSAVPYLPVAHLVVRHCANLVQA